MFSRSDRLVLSPTDLAIHLGCRHATTLDLQVVRGERERPAAGVDEQLAFIADRGLAHERTYLARLRESGARIVEIPRGPGLEAAEAATVAAMADGADVVYQGTLFDGRWLGYADFLLRRELAPDEPPSAFGDWAYDLADTKLARHLSAAALLQLATYARRLERLQGVPPERLVVVTGDGAESEWRLSDVAAYAARARAGLEWFVADRLTGSATLAEGATEPMPVAACARCRWQAECRSGWEAGDDLVLVAGMRARHRQALRAAGIRDVAGLAAGPDEAPNGVSGTTYAKLRRQARLQIEERAAGEPRFALLPHAPGRGLATLPEPDAGDVYLDFEGDPFAGDGVGREYLAGVWTRDGRFRTWWAHDAGEESRLTADLLGFLVEHWRQHPGMHVYHYAAYEQSALKRMTARYGVAEAELDALLRGGRFVDLYQVVKQGILIGKSSYSIKKLEDLYWGHIRHGEGDEVADAMSSVVEYERWLATRDDDILRRIADYNRDDVRSTLALHDWLEERRSELAAELAAAGEEPLSRPTGVPLEEAEEGEAAQAERLLAERLLEAGDELFAGLVGWHRREDRPEWWDFFRRADASPDELVDESAAIGRLGPPAAAGEKVGKSGRVTSRLWRYEFPPQQGRLERGRQVHDVDTRASVGTLVDGDLDAGWLVLSRSAKAEPAEPRAVMPPGPLDNKIVRGALARQAEVRLAGGASAGTALLDRRVPADLRPLPGESAAEAVVRVGLALDGEVLAVQGPPGAGKTYAASHLVRALLDAGKTVGVTAQSHAVIRNLLTEVGRPALHKVGGAAPDAAPKGVGEQSGAAGAGAVGAGTAGAGAAGHGAAAEGDAGIVATTDNAVVATALADGSARLVGGTAWLWAREEVAGSVDVLVVDEAGQFSLANAVAVAQAARSIVLLGDPQQLTQPTKADHPYGAGVSALGHLIGDHDVIPAERGLFLDETYRMHPAVTDLVSRLSYAGRLRSAPGREVQRIDVPGRPWSALSGAGLRHVPVRHTGNVADSPAEAEAVAALVGALLSGQWTGTDSVSRPMTAADVLVVAPYNAHVERLRAALPAGVRAGTVDAFQGQQAPVVVYATGSSSAAEAPRGLNFLYDVHRLNVAVSRAQAVAVWVGSPALLDAAAATPEQVRLVNALCTFAAEATTVDAGW